MGKLADKFVDSASPRNLCALSMSCICGALRDVQNKMETSVVITGDTALEFGNGEWDLSNISRLGTKPPNPARQLRF
jgi:hypothetical protein